MNERIASPTGWALGPTDEIAQTLDVNVETIPLGPAVNASERKAFEALDRGLTAMLGEDRWLLLTNLTFSETDSRQSDEVDIVAIGPPGVRMIEVKHWTHNWVKRNSDRVEREADLVTRKARRIGTTLRRQVPGLGRVDGVFLVTEAPSRAAALEKHPLVRGVRFHTLKTWQAALGLDGPAVLSVQQVQDLGRFLTRGSPRGVGRLLQRFGDYRQLHLQTPEAERFHRVYKAAHALRRERVILHLYDLSVGDAPNAAGKAEREWKALNRLQRHEWAPRIVDSYQDAAGYSGELAFFTIADPDRPSIGERTEDPSWDTAARLCFTRRAIAALRQLHEEGEGDEPMLHRKLSPETILVRHDNTPILTGFDLARIPADVSVASVAALEETYGTLPLEIRTQGFGAADRRSDVHSLCASLKVLFLNREDTLSQEVLSALDLGTKDDPAQRSNLSEIEGLLPGSPATPVADPPPGPSRFWAEDQVITFRGNRYRIVSLLGSGGVGTAFKVVKIDRSTGEDLGTYVAKTARDKETGERVLRAYNLAHSHLQHSALSVIFEIAEAWREDEFLTLMAWIEGQSLDDYRGVLSLYAEEVAHDSAESLALHWLISGCEALGVLHDNGLVHGDVSPGNLIVSGTELVLTDYDFVDRVGTLVAVPRGTVLYSPASGPEGRAAAASDDFYALAASFFHVLFDREPFWHDGNLAKERGLNWNGLERGDYPALAAFLDRATDPDPTRRFANAKQALTCLSPPSQDDLPAPDEPTRQPNEVPWLRSLLQSYPGSRWGNAETRGLDSAFATDTYVETDLERKLYDDICARRVRLVVLCGNAGDGKTALLQHLAGRLGVDERRSETRILKARLIDGLTVCMNLDGSASWEGRSADDLLDEFLAPFQDGAPETNLVHLLAINDGRLLEWIENVETERGETSLTRNLYRLLLQEEAPTAAHIRFIDLNQRSLVGAVSADGKRIETGFLDRLVDNLYGDARAAEVWAPCRTCSAQQRCEVFRAAEVFGPDGLADEARRRRARQRLFEALQAVHLRGETHITVRELRAALVYILFGIHDCRDYHDGGGSGEVQPEPYWQRAFRARVDCTPGGGAPGSGAS